MNERTNERICIQHTREKSSNSREKNDMVIDKMEWKHHKLTFEWVLLFGLANCSIKNYVEVSTDVKQYHQPCTTQWRL